MIISAVARRYARALAEVSLESQDHEQVAANLQLFAAALSASAELGGVLRTPALSAEKKLAVLQALAEKMGRGLHPLTRNLIQLLLQNNRMGLLGQLSPAFQAALDDKLGVVAGEVTTCSEMNDSQKQALESTLGTLTGGKVQLGYSRDEAMIGGVILRVGSTIYDGSIRRQLQEIGNRLAGTR